MNQTVRAEDLTTIVINEIMYNPEEDDNYNEWIVSSLTFHFNDKG